MKFAEFDQYSENLLLAQYEISAIISHELMKGEIREDFLISTLTTCSEPNPCFVKGTLLDDFGDAGQLDIILCRPYAHARGMGNQRLVSKDHALCVIEVKGNCTGVDLKGAVKKSKTILALQGQTDPLYGVVCYKVALEYKTIMKRFGYSFDSSTNTYYDNATIPNEIEANWVPLKYPELDFFVSLEDGKKLFFRRYEIAPGKYRFIRSMKSPLIQELFAMIRALWIPANHAPVP